METPPQAEAAAPTLDGAPTLELSILELRLRVFDRMTLPRHPGSTLRGSIGQAFRVRVCTTAMPTCEGCPVRATCSYGVVWETPPPRPDLPRRFGDPPRPYVIEDRIVGARRTFIQNDLVTFRIKLFGRGRIYAPHLILATAKASLKGLGAGRGEAVLHKVEGIDAWGVPTLLYQEREKFQRGGHEPLPTLTLTPRPDPGDTPRRLRLELETPLHLKREGRLLNRFDPEAFTRALIQRIELLALYHHDHATAAWDFHALRAAAARVRIVHEDTSMERYERFSNRSDQRVEMAGLLGSVVLDEVHPALVGLWRAASLVHVGKNATFGFGLARIGEVIG